jgi:hypothetical protein
MIRLTSLTLSSFLTLTPGRTSPTPTIALAAALPGRTSPALAVPVGVNASVAGLRHRSSTRAPAEAEGERALVAGAATRSQRDLLRTDREWAAGGAMDAAAELGGIVHGRSAGGLPLLPSQRAVCGRRARSGRVAARA